MNCPLCEDAGGLLLWTQGSWRVVRVLDEQFPAYYRVITQRHLAEFSHLASTDRQRCMDLVCAVEQVLVERLRPTKVNLAALGNMVPHLHWHVIARFEWDSHFPQAIWGTQQRDVVPTAVSRLPCSLQELDDGVVAALHAA